MSLVGKIFTIKLVVLEAKLLMRDKTILFWFLFVLLLSSISVWFGLAEVRQQNTNIQTLRELDEQERLLSLSKQKDWGSAAYYSFHLTYDRPSDFAFAAMGQRDLQPWKHRIRMLALEGQVYERDVGNPVVALIGRFDFAFLSAFILPLILVITLYDLRSGERKAGRQNLLESTIGTAERLWFARVGLRAALLYAGIIIPLIFASVFSATKFNTLVLACLAVFFYIVFWTALCYRFGRWQKTGSVILMSLVACWLLLAVVFPVSARLLIDRAVSVPSGADILLLQRETVNDAWDLPREDTMKAFFNVHPQWSDYQAVEGSFEWQWYYAFQQVGDQKTQKLSTSYLDGRIERDRLAAWASLIAPPSLLERTLQSLAQTDQQAAIHYEKAVRTFHTELRNFYYPKFFQNEAFEQNALKDLPRFQSLR